MLGDSVCMAAGGTSKALVVAPGLAWARTHVVCRGMASASGGVSVHGGRGAVFGRITVASVLAVFWGRGGRYQASVEVEVGRSVGIGPWLHAGAASAHVGEGNGADGHDKECQQ